MEYADVEGVILPLVELQTARLRVAVGQYHDAVVGQLHLLHQLAGPSFSPSQRALDGRLREFLPPRGANNELLVPMQWSEGISAALGTLRRSPLTQISYLHFRNSLSSSYARINEQWDGAFHFQIHPAVDPASSDTRRHLTELMECAIVNGRAMTAAADVRMLGSTFGAEAETQLTRLEISKPIGDSGFAWGTPRDSFWSQPNTRDPNAEWGPYQERFGRDTPPDFGDEFIRGFSRDETFQEMFEKLFGRQASETTFNFGGSSWGSSREYVDVGPDPALRYRAENAARVFGFSSLDEVDRATVTDKFRKEWREKHTDTGHELTPQEADYLRQLTEARQVLNEWLKSLDGNTPGAEGPA